MGKVGAAGKKTASEIKKVYTECAGSTADSSGAETEVAIRRETLVRGTGHDKAWIVCIQGHVAESYNRQELGTIKMFRSLAQAREWLSMPASDQSKEFFAVKGDSDDGIFTDMTQAVTAKAVGAARWRCSRHEKRVEVYLRPAEAYVVWVGRKVGIMNKSQLYGRRKKCQWRNYVDRCHRKR